MGYINLFVDKYNELEKEIKTAIENIKKRRYDMDFMA
jgi:uncharacterized protein YdcH (DUF465 family)